MKPFALLVAASLVSAAAAADTPITMLQMGRLHGADDKPVADGELAVTFAIRKLGAAVPQEEAAVWTATCNVGFHNGVYSVTLGEECGTGLFAEMLPVGQARYLEFTVGGNVLAPRLRFTAAPTAAFAAVADNALALGGVPAGDYLRAGSDISGQKVGSGQSAPTLQDVLDDTPSLTGPNAFTNPSNTFTGSGAGLTRLGQARMGDDASSQTLNQALTNLSDYALKAGANAFTGENTFSNPANSFAGVGSGLTGIGGAHIGNDASDTLNAKLATLGQADQIKGVAVDDANRQDGYVLRYNADTNKIEYTNVVVTTPPDPPVPATVSWSGVSQTGNSKCAAARGVCTGAKDNNNTVIFCSNVVSIGSATCARSDSINQSAKWTSTATGNSACASQVANCVQAYDASGNSIECNASITAGTAACLLTNRNLGWDTYASWSVPRPGHMGCAEQGANCVQAFSASGTGEYECSYFLQNGSAKCIKAQLGEAWDKAVTWINRAASGSIECAKVGADCVNVYYASATTRGTNACAASTGADGYVSVATCKTISASSTWDSVAQWSAQAASGSIECAKIDADCVDVYYGGGSFGTSNCGAATATANHYGLARCKKRTSTSTWDSTASWFYQTSLGVIECAKIDANCVDVYYGGLSFGTTTCAVLAANADHYALARCKKRTAADTWDTTVVWANMADRGHLRCTAVDAECIDTHYFNPGLGNAGSHDCIGPTGTTGYTVLARCKKADRTADGWNKGVNWSGSSTTGDAQCATIGATCVGVYDAADASSKACSTAISSGAAKCNKP